jgi:hypothetical protein
MEAQDSPLSSQKRSFDSENVHSSSLNQHLFSLDSF